MGRRTRRKTTMRMMAIKMTTMIRMTKAIKTKTTTTTTIIMTTTTTTTMTTTMTSRRTRTARKMKLP